MSHTDIMIWPPGDVPGTSKTWSRYASIWCWILTSWRLPMDVRFWSNLSYLLMSHPDVVAMSMDVILWPLILMSQQHAGDVRTMVIFTDFKFWHPQDVLWMSEYNISKLHLDDHSSIVPVTSGSNVSVWCPWIFPWHQNMTSVND